MKKGEIYLDNNASSRVLPEVLEKTFEVLKLGGNPSSPHSCGKTIRDIVENSRNRLAFFVGADPDEIVFTSSGTEANNMALRSLHPKAGRRKMKIVTTSVEHSSVKKTCSSLKLDGAEIICVSVDGDGIADMGAMEKHIEDGADLVSFQWVNNETGVIQDIETVVELCRQNGVTVHTDAAQAPGKLPVDLGALGVDLATLTGHKFNALQGCGAIFVKDKMILNQMLFGGFQEGGFRPGTENIAGIKSMGEAAGIRGRDIAGAAKHLAEMRDFFEGEIIGSTPGSRINGSPEKRAPNTANIMFRGIDGAKMTAVLDSLGVKCSQSSACTTSDPSPSYVLTEMGLSEQEAGSSIRFSFGVDNTIEEARKAANIVKEAHRKCA